jgi:hypothetical protein
MAGPIIAGEHPRAQAVFLVLFIAILLMCGFRKELSARYPWFGWIMATARYLLRLR